MLAVCRARKRRRVEMGGREGKEMRIRQFLPRGTFPWRKHCKNVSEMVVDENADGAGDALPWEAAAIDVSWRARYGQRAG